MYGFLLLGYQERPVQRQGREDARPELRQFSANSFTKQREIAPTELTASTG